jgi:maltooligosyltrehalose synthase
VHGWRDTTITLPPKRTVWRNVFNNATVETDAAPILVGRLLWQFPIGIYLATDVI